MDDKDFGSGEEYLNSPKIHHEVYQDFDRGMVQMKCDQRGKGCAYGLPHYHCQICGRQVNDDEIARCEFHPCCSLECIKNWNQQLPPFFD